MNWDLAVFPPLFLSEGKAMELFRKLREKPRGVEVTHAAHSLHNTVLSRETELSSPPAQTRGVQGTAKRWCVWWFKRCSSMRGN